MRGESTLNLENFPDGKKKKKNRRLRRILGTLDFCFNLGGRRILIRNPEI